MTTAIVESSSEAELRATVRYLERTGRRPAGLLADLRDSLEHGGAGTRREAEALLRDLEAVADGLNDAAFDALNEDEDLW